MNTALMKATIVKNGDTQDKLAKFLGISLSNLNLKISGRGAGFRQKEIVAIQKRYSLSAEEIESIFFRADCPDKTTNQ